MEEKQSSILNELSRAINNPSLKPYSSLKSSSVKSDSESIEN